MHRAPVTDCSATKALLCNATLYAFVRPALRQRSPTDIKGERRQTLDLAPPNSRLPEGSHRLGGNTTPPMLFSRFLAMMCVSHPGGGLSHDPHKDCVSCRCRLCS